MFKKVEEKITMMVRDIEDMKKIQMELAENFFKKNKMGLTAD